MGRDIVYVQSLRSEQPVSSQGALCWRFVAAQAAAG